MNSTKRAQVCECQGTGSFLVEQCAALLQVSSSNFEPLKMDNETLKMDDITVQFKKLEATVGVISGNLDQAFLIFMGCLIFCKYMFWSYYFGDLETFKINRRL